MKVVYAIDPGLTHSGYVVLDDNHVVEHKILENNEILKTLKIASATEEDGIADITLAVESMMPYSGQLRPQVIGTLLWAGRFAQQWICYGGKAEFITRKDVKVFLLGRSNGGDVEVRGTLMEKWGGEEEAKGTKANPGPLFGIKSHEWSALAVAVTMQHRMSLEDDNNE